MQSEHVILLVDADSINRTAVSAVLRQEGYRLHEASLGRGALARARREALHGVILDLDLPDMEGPSVLENLRLLRPGGVDEEGARSDELAAEERVVESLQLMAGARTWRLEPVRGPGGASPRLAAIGPAGDAVTSFLVDEALVDLLQGEPSRSHGGIRRVLDAICRGWTRSGRR